MFLHHQSMIFRAKECNFTSDLRTDIFSWLRYSFQLTVFRCQLVFGWLVRDVSSYSIVPFFFLLQWARPSFLLLWHLLFYELKCCFEFLYMLHLRRARTSKKCEYPPRTYERYHSNWYPGDGFISEIDDGIIVCHRWVFDLIRFVSRWDIGHSDTKFCCEKICLFIESHIEHARVDHEKWWSIAERFKKNL